MSLRLLTGWPRRYLAPEHSLDGFWNSYPRSLLFPWARVYGTGEFPAENLVTKIDKVQSGNSVRAGITGSKDQHQGIAPWDPQFEGKNER